jgi:antitoxin component of RelBE/YafQ-DinJ toxin-antitoxin module
MSKNNSHRIQITIDDQLMKTIQSQASQMGLSVSSFSRLALKNVLQPTKAKNLLDHALEEMKTGQTETLTLEQFKHQLDK